MNSTSLPISFPTLLCSSQFFPLKVQGEYATVEGVEDVTVSVKGTVTCNTLAIQKLPPSFDPGSFWKHQRHNGTVHRERIRVPVQRSSPRLLPREPPSPPRDELHDVTGMERRHP